MASFSGLYGKIKTKHSYNLLKFKINFLNYFLKVTIKFSFIIPNSVVCWDHFETPFSRSVWRRRKWLLYIDRYESFIGNKNSFCFEHLQLHTSWVNSGLYNSFRDLKKQIPLRKVFKIDSCYHSKLATYFIRISICLTLYSYIHI